MSIISLISRDPNNILTFQAAFNTLPPTFNTQHVQHIPGLFLGNATICPVTTGKSSWGVRVQPV